MFKLYRKITKTGWELEDGSNNIKFESEFILVPFEELDDFVETMASDYGYQDYSYQVNYKEIMELSKNNLIKLNETLKEQIKNMESKNNE